MSGTLIPSGGLFFYVIEVSSSNEGSNINHLAKTTLKSVNGPMRVYAVFSDVDMIPAVNGRFFTKQIEAKKFFDVVCDDVKRYGNPLINGMTLEEAHAWADALTPSEYRRIVNPTDYGRDVVYREYAGVQVVGERDSFERLELDNGGEELPLYKENHDDYFCIRVDLTEHQDENVLAFLYVKDRNNLVAVMDKLLDTFINVEVVVSSVERLKALMGEPEQEVAPVPYTDLVVGRTGGIIMYGRAIDFHVLGISVLPDRIVEEVFTDYHLEVRTAGHSNILFWVRDADLLAMLAQAITVVVERSIVTIMEGDKPHQAFMDGSRVTGFSV